MGIFKKSKTNPDLVDQYLKSFTNKKALKCPTCNTSLSEKDQIGAGDNAAVMANLGVMEVKIRCPGCRTVFDVTIPRGYEWKSSIDIPGWGRFPK
jgi:uncharacterized protein with PIN domain